MDRENSETIFCDAAVYELESSLSQCTLCQLEINNNRLESQSCTLSLPTLEISSSNDDNSSSTLTPECPKRNNYISTIGDISRNENVSFDQKFSFFPFNENPIVEIDKKSLEFDDDDMSNSFVKFYQKATKRCTDKLFNERWNDGFCDKSDEKYEKKNARVESFLWTSSPSKKMFTISEIPKNVGESFVTDIDKFLNEDEKKQQFVDIEKSHRSTHRSFETDIPESEIPRKRSKISSIARRYIDTPQPRKFVEGFMDEEDSMRQKRSKIKAENFPIPSLIQSLDRQKEIAAVQNYDYANESRFRENLKVIKKLPAVPKTSPTLKPIDAPKNCTQSFLDEKIRKKTNNNAEELSSIEFLKRTITRATVVQHCTQPLLDEESLREEKRRIRSVEIPIESKLDDMSRAEIPPATRGIEEIPKDEDQQKKVDSSIDAAAGSLDKASPTKPNETDVMKTWDEEKPSMCEKKVNKESMTSKNVNEESQTSMKVPKESLTSKKVPKESLTSRKVAKELLTSMKVAKKSMTSKKVAKESMTSKKVAKESLTSKKVSKEALASKKVDNELLTSTNDHQGSSRYAPLALKRSPTPTELRLLKAQVAKRREITSDVVNRLHHLRTFKLRLVRDTTLYHKEAVFEASNGRPISFDPTHTYTGTLEDEENSLVHGIVTSDGLFDGTVITASGDEIYIEPTTRYVPTKDRNIAPDGGTQNDNSPISHHTIAYRSSDVATPLRNQQPCNIEIIHKKDGKHESTSHRSNETQGYHWINVTSSPHQQPNDGKSLPKPGFYPKDARKKDPNASSHNLELLDKLYRERYSRVLRKRTSVDPKKTTCMLYLQADHTFFEHYKSEEACIEVMTRHVQRVNSIYRYTDFNQDGQPDNISFMIKRVKVHGEESLSDPSYRYTGTYGVEEYLELFSEEDYDAFCLSYMFTYRDFEKGTLGLAWTGDLKNAGGVCEKNGHYRGSMKSLNTGIITLLNYGKHVPPAVSHVTLAHEIGHNFGSPHDPDECSPGGLDGNFIMFARATSGDKRNNNRFSPCSLVSINPVLNAKARSSKGCFAEPQTAICGNGVVEQGEECDCGWEEDCNDPCCHPQRLHHAPFEIPCRLTEDAVCSPSQGPCCTSGCTLRTGDKCRDDNGCRDASFCSGLGPQCPPSINKPNKTICNEEFVCYMGECTGSICLAYGLESCQCIAGPDDPPTKSCELCCKLPGEDQLCLSSFAWNTPPYEIPNMMSKPGTPCNDYNGYCDVFQRCREVDPSGPLATLRRLLLSDASLAQFQRWMADRWYAVALGILAALLGLTIMARLLGKRADARLKAQSIGEHPSTLGYPSALGTGATERDRTNRIGKIARIKRRIVETMKTFASPRKTKDSSSLSGDTRISKILCFVKNDRERINSYDTDRNVTRNDKGSFDESNVEKGFASPERESTRRDRAQMENRRNDRNCKTSQRDRFVLETPRSLEINNEEPEDDEDEDVFRRTIDSSRTEGKRTNDDWPFLEFVERIYRGKTFRVRKKLDIGGKMRKIERLCGSPKFRCEKSMSTSGSEDCCVNQSVPLVSPDTPETPPDITEPRLINSDLDVLLRES